MDPEAPSVVVWELRDGAYVEAAHATGAETLDVLLPYPVTLVPAELVR